MHRETHIAEHAEEAHTTALLLAASDDTFRSPFGALRWWPKMESGPPREEDDRLQVEERGGIKTLPTILVNEMLEKVAGFGLNANMITYLTKQYHLSNAASQTMIFVWGAVSSFAPIPGAVVADVYIGRFMAISLGSVSCLIGIIFLWLSAMIPGARPPPCNGEQCAPPGARHLVWLHAGFAFLSIGAGGVRPCSMAFGAEQFSRYPKERRSRILQIYFNAYYASVGVAFAVAVTGIVYVQDNIGWRVGFAVPMCLMLLSTVSFLLGSGLYIKEKGNNGMLGGMGKAVVAAIKNNGARLPAKTDDGVYHHLKECKLTVPTDQLRFLNKACMVREDAAASERHGNIEEKPLCTVDQVEQLKSVIRVLPIWSSTIYLALAINTSIAVKQADMMDRRIGGFNVPSGSLALFNMLTMSLWSAIYGKWIVPALQRYTGDPCGLTTKQRVGGGLLLATAATAVSAVVEGARRRQSLCGVTISAFWLVPQFALAGLAEAFGMIGEIEFFYKELPKSMASFSVSLMYMAMGVGNLVGALIVKLIQVASTRGGKTGWLVNDLDAGHYDYYYWLLACYGSANFVYFAWCSWAYGEEGKNVDWEDDEEEAPVV